MSGRQRLSCTRVLVAILCAALLSSCSHTTAFDSCSRIRHFKQYSWPSRAYFALPPSDVASLPSTVRDAVAAYMARLSSTTDVFEIVEAHRSDDYLFLEVRQACFDCSRWVVYSTEQRCIVGYFVPVAGQG